MHAVIATIVPTLFGSGVATQDANGRAITGTVVDTAGNALPYVKNGSCGIVLSWTR